jgi:hypothetical protein
MLLALLELIAFLIALLFLITQIVIPLSQNEKPYPIFRKKEKESEKKPDSNKKIT